MNLFWTNRPLLLKVCKVVRLSSSAHSHWLCDNKDLDKVDVNGLKMG